MFFSLFVRKKKSTLGSQTCPRYDWMRNEPNDWHGQSCLTFLKDQVIETQGLFRGRVKFPI